MVLQGACLSARDAHRPASALAREAETPLIREGLDAGEVEQERQVEDVERLLRDSTRDEAVPVKVEIAARSVLVAL